ncbi:hypothetical protein BS50DRAFT_626142 [Corynespora cassiicola Philippines]|uniref:Zn(2)-C6 fungal-type domain-containing protein n=1 Tax=Corynespora cassiicola Philippines TaxID=1448308 RepID=A0A2T2N430_CORCC|nr:hypothetical protein BS50DRAFT_626142 [Corynespora cassiicola Philippines]
MPSKAQASFQVLSFDTGDVDVREYKKRRMHKKVKSGCLMCREKRVKCDEGKPTCARCERNDRECIYEDPEKSNIQPLSAVTLMPFSLPESKDGTPTTHLMIHLDRHWGDILPLGRHDAIMAMFQSSEMLRSTMLAVAACHMRHVVTENLQHRIAEHFQQGVAIEHYRKALATPIPVLGQDGVNKLIISASFLNMVNFSLPGVEASDPMTSWVFSDKDDRLGWFSLQAGLRPLMRQLMGYQERTFSFIGTLFWGNKHHQAVREMIHRPVAIPPLWQATLGVDGPVMSCDHPAGADDEAVLQPALTMLSRLHEPDHAKADASIYLQFLGKTSAQFTGLLKKQDERAYWILGYWLGLMWNSTASWWCHARARRDYEAIRIWLKRRNLDQRPGEEGIRWGAMMCEYESVITQWTW